MSDKKSVGGTIKVSLDPDLDRLIIALIKHDQAASENAGEVVVHSFSLNNKKPQRS